jgi:signal transduction histidine kinase
MPQELAAAKHASPGRSAPFAPTVIDHLLARIQRATPKLAQTSDRLLIGITALLTLVDVAVWRTDRVVDLGRLSTSIAFLVPVLGALATVAVAVRRRCLALSLSWLTGASMVLTISSWAIGSGLPPSFAALLALALLTTAVLRHEPSRPAVVLTIVAAVAVGTESLRPMVGTAAYLLVLCEGAFGVAVGVGVYLRWSDWRRVAAAETARTDERLEIARELHDMVGHYVTGIVVQAQAARHVAANQPSAAVDALGRIEVAGRDAMAAMRRMVGGLRDQSAAEPRRTWDTIDELLADAVAHGEPVRATIDPAVRNTALALVPSVHRIIAESLTNARRHAHGVTRIEVAVFQCADRLVVTIHDDGLVAANTVNDTFGIIGMRERATALGGSLFAGRAPNGGWLVQAELPMERPS